MFEGIEDYKDFDDSIETVLNLRTIAVAVIAI